MTKHTIEQVRADANKYITKNLELFNQEPTYSQVIGFVVKPILADYDELTRQNKILIEMAKFYADGKNWNLTEYGECQVLRTDDGIKINGNDWKNQVGGKKAREALKSCGGGVE